MKLVALMSALISTVASAHGSSGYVSGTNKLQGYLLLILIVFLVVRWLANRKK